MPTLREAETGGSLEVPGQPGLCTESLQEVEAEELAVQGQL